MAQKSKGDSPAIIIAAIIGALATIIAAIITVTAVNQKNDAVAQKNEVAKEATSSLATNVVLQKTVDAPTPTLLPTNPPPPTSVPQATYTPYPTYTPRPPLPTYTPEPTHTPIQPLATNTPIPINQTINRDGYDITIVEARFVSKDKIQISIDVINKSSKQTQGEILGPISDRSYFIDENGKGYKNFITCYDNDCGYSGPFSLPLNIKHSFYLVFRDVSSNIKTIPYFKLNTLGDNLMVEFRNLQVNPE